MIKTFELEKRDSGKWLARFYDSIEKNMYTWVYSCFVNEMEKCTKEKAERFAEIEMKEHNKYQEA